jgi:hypothetical protein
MSRVIYSVAAVLCLIGILGNLSFAADCALCAPHASKSVPVQKTGKHDHCGSTQKPEQNSFTVTYSHCGHAGVVCMTAYPSEVPAAQPISSLQLIAASTSASVTLPESYPSSPPGEVTLYQRPTFTLLAANLRV